MRKIIVVLIFLVLSLLQACNKKETYVQPVQLFDYKKPAELLIEITDNSDDSKIKEAAKLNLELTQEENLANKAAILMKLNNLLKKKPSKTKPDLKKKQS